MYKLSIKILLFSFFVALFASCSNQSVVINQSTTNNQTTQMATPKEEKPLEKLSNPRGKINLPNIKAFGVFHVLRKSDQENESGRGIKPFYEAEIGISINEEPKLGEKVTVIPLNVDIEPFQLLITGAVRTEEPCTGAKKKYYWDTEIEKVINKEILEIEPIKGRADEFPFDVAVIYPSVNFAKNIANSELSIHMLPKDVAIKTIVAAIDLDNDGKPDLVEAIFCCMDPKENCELHCQKTFKKIGGKWKLMEFAGPC